MNRKHYIIIVTLIVLGGLGYLIKGHGIRGKVARMMTAQPQPQQQVVPVTSVRPSDGAFEVPTSAIVTAELRVRSGQLNLSTINAATVMLVRTSDQTQVPATVKLTGKQTIQLRPDQPLAAAMNYTFCITGNVRHQSGAPVTPWATSFTTVNEPDATIAFERVTLPTATAMGVTCMNVAPDGRLWATTDDGRFLIFSIENDGILSKPRVIESLQKYNQGPRLIIGFCFDPASTPQHPIVWVCNNAFTFANAPDFSGKVTRMSGPDLEDVGDVVVNLPRSVRDHMTNQPAIGPDGGLYFPQGSSSSFGAPDEIWGMRIEHLLTATILRVERDRMAPGKPIDVLTPDAGGTYDPFAPDAPVKIYATGVRNAYDCVWHSNGQLYVPTNGSSAGGHAPAGGGAPPVRDITTAEDDWLFRIAPGKYHGHPNPFHNHFVLNGGNPTAGYDFAETCQYPVGVGPDADYVPPVYSFGKHVSANGVIEYMSDVFGGRLKHALLVCRYNVGSDIIALALDDRGGVRSQRFGMSGLSNLINPLDITEDRRNGNLYVSEYGAMRITLFRPAERAMVAMPE